MLSSPNRISLLPEHLIDQIKAGEVIERPGNLIKEILENSIDAGSRRLEITLKNNGLDLIQLKDDGHGILSEDLPLAFSRHATSKISRFEDLYHLHSFGFRGEALASIAAISRLQCISFTQNEDEGSEIRIEGGLTTFSGKRLKSGSSQGTELVVQDLFFNTPVRLKFIQSQQAEKNFIKRVLFSFILAHPGVEFVIKLDDDEKDIYQSRMNLQERLLDILPKARDLILQSSKSYEENKLDLFIIPGHFKAPVKLQYIFINNRYVLDKQLHRVLSNSLAASFGSDDFHFVAFVNLPSDHVDVNVHPNKTIIKLFEASKVISLISASVKELSNTNKAPKIQENILPAEKTFFENLHDDPTSLPQERHDYNMEGHFSPHSLPLTDEKKIIWLGRNFLYSNGENWEAISAPKLLSYFVHEKFKSPFFQTIPLLVSEPFKNKGLSPERYQEFLTRGLELEKLSADTLVLRSIPDWMNGFPLKDIITALIEERPIENLEIHSEDWSQSSWEEMIQTLSIQELRSRKITLDLKQLLEEKLR